MPKKIILLLLMKSPRLLTNLQNVSARQWGQPGGVDLTTSPVVQELIARGDEAIPPLLDAMGQDYRLTRSVSFHRDYFTNRHLIGAAEAAYAALCKISGQSFGPATDIAAGGKKRALLVKNARAHWKGQDESATTNQALGVLQNDKAYAATMV